VRLDHADDAVLHGAGETRQRAGDRRRADDDKPPRLEEWFDVDVHGSLRERTDRGVQ
jgi:hypothetical protein